MSSKTLTLGRGCDVAIVDSGDYRKLSKRKWRNYSGYVVSGSGKNQVWLHHEVLGVVQGTMIDHKNGNGLDNRKSNLRIASKCQNMMNKGLTLANTSGFKGVSKTEKKWSASICSNGQQVYLGSFATAQIAGLAYDEAARKLHGEHGRYNFPKEGELSVKGVFQKAKAKTYIRKTISLPVEAMNLISKKLARCPGLTLSSFLTESALSNLETEKST